MFNDIVLVHRRGAEGFETPQNDWFFWQTCLRRAAFGSADGLLGFALHSEDQILRGEDAYRFCLEVICGLQSPLIGETEVLGQFKNAVETWALPESPWGREMARFVRSLLEDAKKIRSSCLTDLGSQSYGSLLRRELQAVSEVHILGGGHLVGEILPWLCKDGIKVVVHVRDLVRVADLAKQVPLATFRQLETFGDASLRGALVVAAPLPAKEIARWLSQTQIERVADLRQESTTDALPAFGVKPFVLDLSELMNRIAANQELLDARRARALVEIEDVVTLRLQHIEYRPFGWEDVCA